MELTIQKIQSFKFEFYKVCYILLFEKNKLTHLTTIQKNIFINKYK